MSIIQKQFRHKVTGEVVTQIPIMSMGDYEEIEPQTSKADIIKLIEKADKIIKKGHRYACGLTQSLEEYKSGELFFESPDGQDCELFYELKRLGFINSGYQAPYDWGVSKDGWKITYTEGDIYIRPLKAS